MNRPQSTSSSKILIWSLIVYVLLAIVVVIAGSILGGVKIDFARGVQLLVDTIFRGADPMAQGNDAVIMINMRMPRMILALAVGGGLAVAGCAMQAITQNVLADPYILGLSSGASAMVAFCFLIFGSLLTNPLVVPLFAFLGAMLAMVLVYSLGMGGNVSGNSTNRLILTGMAVALILNALGQFIITLLPNALEKNSAAMWMWGSLSSARWSNLALPVLSSIIVTLLYTVISDRFNLISLGESTAVTLGMNTSLMRGFVMVTVSILTGVLISSSGAIGFVGYIIPHTVRMLFGADHKKLFPLAFFVGGLFLACIEVLSRVLLAPKEVPIGIFCAFFGGPFFVYLIFRQNKTGRL
ncbi:MAG: iron ABC transporter permease [Christensenellaceae bacterium]|nr:iron ABC transporter permease [Christensenellaceae bacterium]